MSDKKNRVERETVEGAVGRVLFSNDENGWCAVRLQPEEGDSVTAIGPLLGVRQGDELRITVIATGFNANAKRQTGPATANILELPRRHHLAEEDLEIPAFLRSR